DLDHARVGDVLDEQCIDVLAPDLVDQLGQVPCRWFGLGADAFWSKKRDAIGAAEIAEGVMAGDHPALRAWHIFDLPSNIGVERSQRADVAISGGMIFGSIGRI